MRSYKVGDGERPDVSFFNAINFRNRSEACRLTLLLLQPYLLKQDESCSSVMVRETNQIIPLNSQDTVIQSLLYVLENKLAVKDDANNPVELNKFYDYYEKIKLSKSGLQLTANEIKSVLIEDLFKDEAILCPATFYENANKAAQGVAISTTSTVKRPPALQPKLTTPTHKSPRSVSQDSRQHSEAELQKMKQFLQALAISAELPFHSVAYNRLSSTEELSALTNKKDRPSSTTSATNSPPRLSRTPTPRR